jgi:hypothetical protein
MTIRSRSWFVPVAAVALVLALVAPAFAYSYIYPLSSTDIRDAYFIGRRNDEITSQFLTKYTCHFDKPSSGPYISDVSIDTPFTQIVTFSARAANYNAPTAVQDFQDKPMKFFAHVTIFTTDSYQIAQTNSTSSLYPTYRSAWQDFKVKLVQGDNHVIQPLSVDGETLYPPTPSDGVGLMSPIGAQIDLQYAAKKIDADTTTISIDSPDGQHVEATFDLTSLR